MFEGKVGVYPMGAFMLSSSSLEDLPSEAGAPGTCIGAAVGLQQGAKCQLQFPQNIHERPMQMWHPERQTCVSFYPNLSSILA